MTFLSVFKLSCLFIINRCVQELSLQEGETVAMEIQFQLDRQPFCEMHYALDKLHNVDIVFPDLSKIDPSWALQPDTKIR